MAASSRPRLKRLLLAGLVFYALGATLALYPPVRAGIGSLLGVNHASLLIISKAAIDDVRVAYDGNPVTAPFALHRRQDATYGVIVGLRSLKSAPVIEVSWRTGDDSRSVRQTMPEAAMPVICLYMLSIDDLGRATPRNAAGVEEAIGMSCIFQ